MTGNGDRLPGGFRVALDPAARWTGDGTVLVGGSPIRLLRLTAAGRELVDRWASGAEVPGSAAAQGLARRLLAAGLVHPRPPAREPVSPGEVAVVIPVRNDAEGLAATLAALGRGGHSSAGPVVVVDDASDDAVTLGAGHRSAGPVVVVDDACVDAVALDTGPAPPAPLVVLRPVQGGPAAARNDGWRATEAPIVAFLDANCEPEPDWLDRLLPHFADPRVAAVAPRISPPAGGRGVMAAYEAVASPLDLGDREALVRPRSPVAYVPTAALVVRRSALDALGGFDESLTVGEDVDFVWRLAAAGWTVRYEPRTVVRHPNRPSWAGWLRQRYRYGTSAAALARRHGWAVAPAVVSPWTAGAWTLAALGRPLLGAAAAGSSTVALGRRVPPSVAVRLAGLGHVRGGLALARAVRRAWAPAAVVVAVTSRRTRPALAAVAVVPGALEWARRRPRLDPVRFTALRLADDLAYCAGVWAGCGRERSVRALWPDLRGARTEPGGPN